MRHRIPTFKWQTPFYYGWVIIAVVFLAEFFSAGMGTFTIGLFFTPMNESLGWSMTQLTGAVTAQALAAIAVAPLVGLAMDRFGARPVMLFGAVGAGLGLLFLAKLEAVWQFWVLYAMVGALGLYELGQLTGPVVVSKWFVRLRGRAMALATMGTLVGGMVMAPVTGLLISAVGWRNTWQIMGITLLMVMVPLIAVFMRRQPEDLGLRPDGDSAEEGTSQPGSATPSVPSIGLVETTWTLREALHTRSLWLVIIALNLGSLAVSVQTIHAVPFFTQQEDMSTQAASLIITARLLGASLFRLPWGLLVERIPVRICLAISFTSRTLGLLSLVVLPYPFNIPPYVVLQGFGAAFGVLQPMIFANYFGRTFQGTIQGVMRPFLAGPQIAMPLLAAVLFDATGTFDLAFLIGAVPGFLAVALILMATPPVRQQLATFPQPVE